MRQATLALLIVFGVALPSAAQEQPLEVSGLVGYTPSADLSTGPRQGARWVNGLQEILAGPDGFVGEAHAANSDGSIIVGQTCRFIGTDQSAWM